jgi:3-deoxy-D-manno-octulosonic-acid transferase
MKLIYQISVLGYSFLIRIASLFNSKAKLWVDGRKNIFNLIQSKINSNEEIAWFHCASLGEFEQGKPVIEGFKQKHPHFKIVVTFFSPSGYELRKNYEGADYVFYLPIDTKKNAQKFTTILQPKIAFFVKYEFWFHYLKELHLQQTPTYLISGVFRENQLFFKWYGTWYKKMLYYFTHFFVQNTESETLLKKIGFNNITISGDTRFDRVFENAINTIKLPIIEAFKNNKQIIIGGSSWQAEEKILANYFLNQTVNFKLIIAPHDIAESHIKQIETLFKGNCIRYSKATEQNVGNENILIIDNIGILANAYQYTEIAFVGGGFTGALHNILEPCSFGNLVLFGPNHQKFHEAQDLVTNGGAFVVTNEIDFTEIISKNTTKIDAIKAQNRNFIFNRKGATKLILNTL